MKSVQFRCSLVLKRPVASAQAATSLGLGSPAGAVPGGPSTGMLISPVPRIQGDSRGKVKDTAREKPDRVRPLTARLQVQPGQGGLRNLAGVHVRADTASANSAFSNLAYRERIINLVVVCRGI